MNAMSHPFRISTASAMQTPTHIDNALVGAPATSAPPSAGIDSRFSAPYFVRGICWVRKKSTATNSTPMATGWPRHR